MVIAVVLSGLELIHHVPYTGERTVDVGGAGAPSAGAEMTLA